MKKKNIMFCLMAAAATTAWADVTITGTIRDANTHQGLAGVYVQDFLNEKYSVMTDSVGHYKLTVPDYSTSLRVVRPGYGVQQVAINGKTQDLDANLYPNTFSHNIGLKADAQSNIAAPVTDMTADISIDAQIGTALGGQVRSVSRGGVPGLGSFMMLNGINSLNTNVQPLVVIDGVIIDMQYDRVALHDGAYNNLLANISVEDIAEVQVLRNGTAIYGARGANGVIIINTRRNTSLTTKIDFTASTSIAQLPKLPDMMNATQYRTYTSEMLNSTGTKLQEFKFLRDDPSYYYYNMYHNNTDWTKQVYDEAFSQSYNLNVQGGDDVANYNLSVGYTKANATLKENDFTRFNMRINSDVELTSNIKVRLDASFSDVSRDLRDDGLASDIDAFTITSPSFLSLIKSPFLNPYAYDTHGRLSHFYSAADDYLKEVIGDEASLANPGSILYFGERKNKNQLENRMVTLGINPTVKLRHGITLGDAFNFMMTNMNENYFIPPVDGVPVFDMKGVGDIHNKVAAKASHEYLTTNDLYINWVFKKDAHKLNAAAGWRYYMTRYEENSMTGYNSGNEKMPNMNNSLQFKRTDGVNEKNTTLTYYLKADYSWAGKYFAHASMSMEADSRFGADADAPINFGNVAWGLFPSLSAAWVVSNEDWFPHNDIVNYVRLNAGWDMTGNDAIDLNASKTYFKSIKILSGIGGIEAGNIGNSALKWETTNRINWGADLNLLDNRISLAANFYKSYTSDLLSYNTLAYITGIDDNWANGGKLENAGFDIIARGRVLNTRDFQWELGLSVGHYKNKVTELAAGSFETQAFGGSILTKVGQPVGLFYGYKTNGVFATTEEAQQAGLFQRGYNGAAQPFGAGDMRFVDATPDKEINEKDRCVIGDPNPDLYGNITSSLHYKSWSLDMMFNYSLGNDIYNYQRSILECGSRFYNQTTAMRARWSVEGQHTDIPRISYEDPMGNARFSDRWIEDGSYLRLKNITISHKWDFNYRFLQGVTVWGSADNLFTATKYLGSDPECSASNNVLLQGIDRGILPSSRTFSVGVKVNL